MKLNLFFLLMDLLTALAYPFILVWQKLHRSADLDKRGTFRTR